MNGKIKGSQRLANTLQRRMSTTAQYQEKTSPELGAITGAMGLKLDSFQQEIPAGAYLVCNALKAVPVVTTSSAGDPSHTHTVNLSSVHPALKPGDRVLVVWASGEPVVVDRVV